MFLYTVLPYALSSNSSSGWDYSLAKAFGLFRISNKVDEDSMLKWLSFLFQTNSVQGWFLPCANLGSTNPPTKCREVGTFIYTSPHTHCHRAFYTAGTSGETCMYSCCRSGSHPPARMYFLSFRSTYAFSSSSWRVLLGSLKTRRNRSIRSLEQQSIFYLGQFQFGKSCYWLHPVVLCFLFFTGGFCWCEGKRVCGGN